MHKILLFEDNKLNQRLLIDLLQTKGIVCRLAHNGKDADKLVNEFRPDLVLMDIKMPDVSGEIAVRLIRQFSDYPDVPIVALTTHAMKGDREKFIDFGCDDYISKPISVTEFLNRITSMLTAPTEGKFRHRKGTPLIAIPELS